MSLWSDFSPGPLNPGERTHNHHTLPREEDQGEGEREGGVGWGGRQTKRCLEQFLWGGPDKKEMDLWQLVNVRCFQFILASLRGEFILVPNDFIKAKVLLPSRPGPGTARPSWYVGHNEDHVTFLNTDTQFVRFIIQFVFTLRYRNVPEVSVIGSK